MATIVLNKGIISYNEIPTVLTDDKPIVFWDTCSLLYFNTIVSRRAYREFDWDKKLLDWVLNGDVYSVTSMLVSQEFNKHHDDFKNKDLGLEAGLIHTMQQYGNIVGGQDKAIIDKAIQSFKLSSMMDRMVCDLWKQTYVINDDTSFIQKAHNRVLSSTPPSGKEQEYKDCYIWETFLTLCDYAPHKNQAYFMTENTDDYCGKKCKTPFPEIQNEMTTHKGQIIVSKDQLWVAIARKLGIIK